MTEIPENLSYTKEHEWIDLRDGEATVGITAVATEALGEIVYVSLPEPGAQVTAGQACGEVESTKSVSDVFAPLTGTVTEVNAELGNDPAQLNSDPYGAGWLFKVQPEGEPDLLSAAQYREVADAG